MRSPAESEKVSPGAQRRSAKAAATVSSFALCSVFFCLDEVVVANKIFGSEKQALGAVRGAE